MDVQLYRKVEEWSGIEQDMESKKKTIISMHAKINAQIEKVWKFWTTPEDILKWNNACDDWQTTRAENDLRAGAGSIIEWKP